MPSIRAAGGAQFECLDLDIAQIISQDGSTCTVKGLKLGNARIKITTGGQSATVIIAVAPEQTYYKLPATQEVRIGNVTSRSGFANAYVGSLPSDFGNYSTEPTYRLAWNWRNPEDYYSGNYGASGINCGIDIAGFFIDPGNSDRQGWVRTTYGFGGWFYDLNGITNAMTNGVQTNANGVKLELVPSFVYDNGVPYLQIIHKLTNTGSTAQRAQKFGATADVMMYTRDDAPLTAMPYGALMTDEHTSGSITYRPTIKLRLISQGLAGKVDNVSTLWLGEWAGGLHRYYIYEDQREDVRGQDSAIAFSYQNIDLAAGETKEFTLWFTLVQ
jgi:hypothetical protein